VSLEANPAGTSLSHWEANLSFPEAEPSGSSGLSTWCRVRTVRDGPMG
jgi:hypothetical protein